MKRNRNDIIAKIKTARTGAQTKANAYENLTSKRYDYWRAVTAIRAYDQALAMFERGTEHKIPDMAATAIADFERARDSDTDEMTLAVADGRRDALASVTYWMNTEEDNS